MDAVDGTAMLADLTTIARWTKYPGTPDELESLRYLEARAAGMGLRTAILFHDAYISLPGSATVEIPGDSMECITHSFSLSSPKDGLRGDLVYVGKGMPADLRGIDLAGRIAVVDGLATPAVANRLRHAGAAGHLHVSPDEHRHEMTLSPVWGNPGLETRQQLPRTVACTVSGPDGARLKARLVAGEKIEIVMHADVDTGWRQIPMLIADLDPIAPADGSYVLFSGHHDTWHYGVMDNGTANVTMLEVARIAAANRRHLRRGLRLAFWSGHSQGRYAGSTWYADNFWDDLERNCVLHVNIDSTGGRGNHDFVSLSGPELWKTAEVVMEEVSGEPIHVKRLGRFGDQSFWGIGIPAILAFGEQPVSSGMHEHFPHPLGWWWHTEGDTLDKIDADVLVRDARFYANIVLRALCDAILPFDFSGATRELHDALEDIAKDLVRWMDITALTSRAALLDQLVGKVSAAAGKTDAETTLNTINATLVAISRALVPIQFTTGDRFEPDPALQQPPFPALAPLHHLAAVEEDGDRRRFATVDARRAYNRVLHALDCAIAATTSCLEKLETEKQVD